MIKDTIKTELIKHKIASVDDKFEVLLKILGFENNSSADGNYDFIFNIKTNDTLRPIIGIKKVNGNEVSTLNKFHKKMWNQNSIPITIFVLPEDIVIYNNYTMSDTKKIINSLSQSGVLAFEDITLDSISSGIFWKRFDKISNRNERVDKRLLFNLKNTILKLHREKQMPISKARNYLSKFIFIKYLEDRGIITSLTYKNFNANCLVEMLSSNTLFDFFQYMQTKFGGAIFDINQKKDIPNLEQLEVIKRFFKGEEIKSGQQNFFPYDFSIVPIELISNIYETFLTLEENHDANAQDVKKNSGSYYTPYFIADMMLKNATEQVKKEEFCVLDPACGSGIFLVLAFKNLVNHYRENNVDLDPIKLKKLLLKNIFGTDINPDALKITLFSLYIALLDCIEPKDIEKNNFQLPEMKDNLFELDFFNRELEIKIPKVDLVIGNPPWKSTNELTKSLHLKYAKNDISDKQICQSFMYRVKDFMSNDTVVALLVTNSVFYNANANKFRKLFLNTFQINTITNFQQIKNDIFFDAKSPCSLVIYKLKISEDNYTFGYYNVERQLIGKILNCLIVDKSDYFKIDSRLIKKYDFIWRVIHSGGELDFEFIKRLSELSSSISEFIKTEQLGISQGVAVANKNNNHKDLANLVGANLSDNFYSYYIDNEKLIPFDHYNFERVHDKDAYFSNNKIIIKRSIKGNSCSAAYIQHPIIFNNDFYCIFSKKKNVDHLLFLTGLINSKLYNYYQFHMSSSYSKGSQPEVRQNEIEDFPMPKLSAECISAVAKNVAKLRYLQSEFITQELENAIPIDTEKYKKASSVKLGIQYLRDKINTQIYKIYEITDNETAVIEHTEKFILSKNIQKFMLDKYTKRIKAYFSNLLGDKYNVYIDSETKFFYTIVLVSLLPKGGSVNSEETKTLENIILNSYNLFSLYELNDRVLIKKDIMGFFEDGFFVVKSNENKYWDDYAAIKDINKFTGMMCEEESDENGCK